MYYPNFSEFKDIAKKGTIIPVYREILADQETPVSAFRKLDDGNYSFLLESVEGGGKWGRYSFIGVRPFVIFRVMGPWVMIEENNNQNLFPHRGDPLNFFRKLIGKYRSVEIKELPRFFGGAVGFFAYEMVDFFEKLPPRKKESFCPEEAIFMIPELLLIFDNQKKTIKILATTLIGESNNLAAIYQEATQKIENLIEKLNQEKRLLSGLKQKAKISLEPNLTASEFIERVIQAKSYIEEGDIIQVVLSQRFTVDKMADEFDLYRALRFINPSPYMFFLRFSNLVIAGSSPEVMVRLTDGLVELRPIAGTRKRGKDEREDCSLANELLNDPKEKAEHIMLVDLGRNDLGRIAQLGSVQVNELMVVERYSHVMHLVSHIQAYLEKGKDAFDVIKATFPAGTLTGAPKIRAMEIIRELEPIDRGPYGGAVGYIGFNGNLDLAITIRSIFVKDEKVYFQAGAGIVADSNPEKELEEVENKVKGMVKALELAARGLELCPEINGDEVNTFPIDGKRE
ncbi:MAG: anthranilate synthase component I [Desulfobacterota bacterium]|nr:anthranilate synthase component I [Thermodesulfobacteriota bacterium]